VPRREIDGRGFARDVEIALLVEGDAEDTFIVGAAHIGGGEQNRIDR